MICRKCFNVTEQELCDGCAKERREFIVREALSSLEVVPDLIGVAADSRLRFSELRVDFDAMFECSSPVVDLRRPRKLYGRFSSYISGRFHNDWDHWDSLRLEILLLSKILMLQPDASFWIKIRGFTYARVIGEISLEYYNEVGMVLPEPLDKHYGDWV